MNSPDFRPPGFGRGPRVSDQLTPEHHAFIKCFLAAERSGDAATALEYHRGIPMFRGSAHQQLLRQLVDLADEMPPWMWARWAAYQCTRAEDHSTEPGDLQRAALSHTLEVFHDETMCLIQCAGGDPTPFVAQTLGQDWAFHQICTFEMGGLALFLDQLAAGRLREMSGLARDWVDADMSGFRLEGGTPTRLRIRDLATDQVHEVLDLGASVAARDRRFLIGRLVPSGTDPAVMFDTRPLMVDQQTARHVACATEEQGGWIRMLDRAVGEGRLAPGHLRSADRELLTDVPGLLLLEAGTAPAAMERTLNALAHGRDEVGRAAFRILDAAAAGTFGEDERAPFVAAAVLDPHAWNEWRRRRHVPSQEWERWAQLVPEPASSRLRLLAEGAAAAA